MLPAQTIAAHAEEFHEPLAAVMLRVEEELTAMARLVDHNQSLVARLTWAAGAADTAYVKAMQEADLISQKLAGIADFLRMIGHSAEVVTGATLDQLVAAIVAAGPDVVFLDIMLGQLDGHAVAKSLRARGCAAYLVAVTGWGEPDDAAYSLQNGFDEHWTKPLDTSRVEVFMRERPGRRIAA